MWPRPGTAEFERMDWSWKQDYREHRKLGYSHEEAAFEASELAQPADVPGYDPESGQALTLPTQYSSNPLGLPALVVGGLLAVGAWLFFRKKPPVGCPVDNASLDAWGKANNRIVIRTTYRNPPSFDHVLTVWNDVIAKAPAGARIVIVTSDNRFWQYHEKLPRLAADLQTSYCGSKH